MFFPLSPFRARQPQTLSSSKSIHVAPFLLPVFFGLPALHVSVESFVRVCSSPQSRTSQKLSPSFVALVKSSLAPLLPLFSLALSSRLAAVPACVLCVCFAYVSMSNDSIPHWPMHIACMLGYCPSKSGIRHR
jgi:hypothetical protein